MQKTADYFIHKAYDPSYYYEQFEKALPCDKQSGSYVELSKRVVHIALPFLSLYRPFGQTLSCTMGSVRLLTSGAGVFTADTFSSRAQQVMQTGLASLALAGTLYHFTLGLYLTNSADLVSNFIHILKFMHQAKYKKAGEEMLQALSSGLYLAIIMTGSLEIVLTSLLIQAMTCFVEAYKDWGKGRLPEALAKTSMGMIRLFQANQQIELIQKRNALYQHYQEMVERLQNGRKIDHLWDHPIVLNAEQLSKGILEDGEGNAYDFGSHFFGYGKQKVSGMNITFQKKEGKVILDFKINSIFRKSLQKLIHELENFPQEELSDLFHLYGSHIEDISIGKQPFKDHSKWTKDLYIIHLQGLGKISIGASKDVVSLYDRITVEMDEGKKLYDFHEALSFFKLEDVLKQSAQEDLDRMKIGYLFQMFSPKEATLFERTNPYFDLPIEEFKKEILKRSPEMQGILDQYLSKIELREILPGRMRFAIDGLSDELQKQGALGLTAALFGTWNESEMNERIASILKMGMISHEMRDTYGYGKNGLSGGIDYYTGGADSVYTQMVTEKNKTFNEYSYYWSPVRFLISPKILETRTYQYHGDKFGTRIIDNPWWPWWETDYLNRDSIFDFLYYEKKHFHIDHEIMIKDRIPPEYITGIVLDSPSRKEHLLRYLRELDLIQKDIHGQETIFSRPIDEFFYVEKKISAQQFV